MSSNDYSDISRDFLSLVLVKPGRPDFGHLGGLMRAFRRFPYENFTKIIRAHEFKDSEKRMRMPDVVFGDHLELGTGGTCFSLTCFFEQILRHAGFETHPVLCDRSYGPDTHCALIVPIGLDRYLVDPGYLMDEPLKIPDHGEAIQISPFQRTRLVRLDGSSQLLLFTEREGRSKLRYRLRDLPVDAALFKSRWIDSFDWAMMRHPCISTLTEDGQIFMRDGLLRRISGRDRAQAKIREDFASKVSALFGIAPSVTEAALDCVRENQDDGGRRWS